MDKVQKALWKTSADTPGFELTPMLGATRVVKNPTILPLPKGDGTKKQNDRFAPSNDTSSSESDFPLIGTIGVPLVTASINHGLAPVVKTGWQTRGSADAEEVSKAAKTLFTGPGDRKAIRDGLWRLGMGSKGRRGGVLRPVITGSTLDKHFVNNVFAVDPKTGKYLLTPEQQAKLLNARANRTKAPVRFSAQGAGGRRQKRGKGLSVKSIPTGNSIGKKRGAVLLQNFGESFSAPRLGIDLLSIPVGLGLDIGRNVVFGDNAALKKLHDSLVRFGFK